MSEHNGEMLAEVWNAMKPYIDKKERPDAAVSYLRAAEDFVSLEDCRKELSGIDTNLDMALNELLGEEDIIDEDEDEGY
jgi:hypothetical protein